MRTLRKSLTLLVFGSLLASGAHAQVEGGTGVFKWYVGGHGGVTSFRTVVDGREFMPSAGGHFLITAKRTGLLLSVDQGFNSDMSTVTFFNVRDSVGNVTQSGAQTWTFDGIRRYSAMLLAYPIRNENIQPFVGLGVGIAHTTGNSAGPFSDRSVEDGLSSSAFGAATAGLEFRLGPFSAFGQYQVTTRHGFKDVQTVLARTASGAARSSRSDFGEWTLGANHTLSGGVRFSLGGSREATKAGGY